jgi:hypothetical protein
MFGYFSEAYYLSRVLEYVDKIPKEIVAAVTVYAIAHEAIKATTDVRVENLRFETARLELEIEQLKKERLNPSS